MKFDWNLQLRRKNRIQIASSVGFTTEDRLTSTPREFVNNTRAFSYSFRSRDTREFWFYMHGKTDSLLDSSVSLPMSRYSNASIFPEELISQTLETTDLLLSNEGVASRNSEPTSNSDSALSQNLSNRHRGSKTSLGRRSDCASSLSID